VLVLALIGATAWVIKRASRNGTLMSALGAGGRAPAGILEVLGRYPISATSTLVMLKVDRRILLIAQSGGGRGGLFGSRAAGPATMQTLSEITDPEDVASILMKVQDDESRAANERFQGLLGQAEREQIRIERAAERRGGVIDSVDLRQTPLAPRRTPRATNGTGKVTA
jgi:flagellar biogenesis protein FliO